MSTIAHAKVAHNYNRYYGYFFGCLLPTFLYRFELPLNIVFVSLIIKAFKYPLAIIHEFLIKIRNDKFCI